MKFFKFLIILILIVSTFIISRTVLATRTSADIQLNPKIEMTPLPEFIVPTSGQMLQKTVAIQVKVKNARGVDLYIQRPDSQSLIYLGAAAILDSYPDKEYDVWHYSWETLKTPNGEYNCFVEISNAYGSYRGQPVLVKVYNPIEKTVESSQKKEQVQAISSQIGQREEQIQNQAQKTAKEIAGEVSNLVDVAKEQVVKDISKETAEEVDKKVVEELLKTKETIGQAIENLTVQIKEEKQIKQEITKNKEAQESLNKQIEVKEKELKTFENIEPLNIVEEKVAEIKKEKQEIIKNNRQEEEEIKKEIQAKEKKLSEIEAKKEENRKTIIQESLKPVGIIKSQTSVPEKIAPLAENAVVKIREKIVDLEERISQEAEAKVVLAEEILKDSDGDGLSDVLELEFGSDPLNPDSDGDGYLDGEEAALGSDVLKPSKGEEIVYQDPRRIEPKKADIFTVEKAEVKKSEITGKSVLRLEGKGLPNTFITLYIYSSLPIVVVSKTDAYGRWVYELDKPLDSGEHEIYVVLTNNQGEITARSESFNFIKSGANILQLIPEVWAKETGKGMEEVASPYEILQRSFIILTLAVIVLAIGVALILVGILNRKGLKVYLSPSKNKKGKRIKK